MIDNIDKIAELWEDWQNDWNLAAVELLDVNLDPEQQAILAAVQHNKMVTVASGTARGKDFVSAVAAFCFMFLTPVFDTNGNLVANTKVALTAPTGRQVSNIMYPEIVRLYNRAKSRFPLLPGRLTGNDIRTDFEEWFLTGFKADENNHEAWSGFHAVNTMFVVTEASGISENTFAAIEGNLQGNSKILLVFNPNNSTGYAAKSMKKARWKKFRLDGLTAPNVVAKKQIIPGQVDYEWVKDKVENWCEIIQPSEIDEDRGDFQWEDSWYRPNDLFRIKVRGMFPEVGENVLIPARWIELANKRWKLKHEPGPGAKVGVDVAGMGRDTSVICNRYGDYVAPFKRHQSGGKADHMKVAGMTVHELKQYKSKAFIDTIGEGAGVYSRLVELGLKKQAVSCKFSESAEGLTDVTGQFEFQNMKAYLYWAVRDWLNPKSNTQAQLPPDENFIEQVSEIKWEFMSNGKIKIEKKEDYKKRTGYSPDDFDALANTFYPVNDFGPIKVNKEDLGIF
nr:hypothetical protein [uncultured Draconibacterium sp.]